MVRVDDQTGRQLPTRSLCHFGLLGAMKGGARSIKTYRISPNVASILAHDQHFRGVGDNALLRSPTGSSSGWRRKTR
jgi:hypothetical protein